jgi:hypothetical protein
VVVADVKPLHLPILIGVNKLVRQVLVGGVFPHLDLGTSDYSRIIYAWLRLHLKEILKQNLVGLDPHKGFAEMHKY